LYQIIGKGEYSDINVKANMKKGTIIIIIYLFLVGLSLLWIKALSIIDPQHSEFAGFWFVLLAFPWSIIFGMIIEQIDPYLLPRIGIKIDFLGVIINCVLIYLIFNSASRKDDNKKKV